MALPNTWLRFGAEKKLELRMRVWDRMAPDGQETLKIIAF